MHAEAFDWVSRYATEDPVAVIDLGGRDLNGSARSLFPAASPYVSLDITDGPGVDIVADAATWQPDRAYDLVVSTECFEHTPVWRQILDTAYRALRPGGELILTMAGPGRPEHSGVDGGWVLHPGEHYANIHPGDLRTALGDAGLVDIKVEYRPNPQDTRGYARRPYDDGEGE